MNEYNCPAIDELFKGSISKILESLKSTIQKQRDIHWGIFNKKKKLKKTVIVKHKAKMNALNQVIILLDDVIAQLPIDRHTAEADKKVPIDDPELIRRLKPLITPDANSGDKKPSDADIEKFKKGVKLSRKQTEEDSKVDPEVMQMRFDGVKPAPDVYKIKLTQDKVALVDKEDLPLICLHLWCARREPYSFYAYRTDRENGKQVTIPMHRAIMGLTLDDKREVDHINHNGLDNRRANLRICNKAQNQHNQRPKVNGSSSYKGVYKRKDYNKWTAQIKCNGKSYYIGSFDNEIDAAKAWDKKAKELHGEFAVLNFGGNNG